MEFQDLFASVPGVANMDQFSIRTGNSKPAKLPPRMIPKSMKCLVRNLQGFK